MVQTAYTQNITDFSVGARSMFTELGVVHDPDANPPYFAAFVRLQATGTPEDVASNIGRLRVVAEFSDGSTLQMTTSDTPFARAPDIPCLLYTSPSPRD